MDGFEFERVLDVGGWFKPDSRATHVADLMPYETRWAKLNPSPLPGERFSKDTWFQVNFLAPSFSLPFDDKFFDFIICGHTIEDLVDPAPLIAEMMRVGKRGVITCPSRLHEQTVGVRDRGSTNCGHLHHHWIVESNSAQLTLWSKIDSNLETPKNQVPLLVYERLTRRDPSSANVQIAWTDSLDYSVVSGPACAARAAEFAKELEVAAADRELDRCLRLARRARGYLRSRPNEDWWDRIVDQSQPFTKISIK